eukprot:7642517-Ditylum_brightwellii.AAC.1
MSSRKNVKWIHPSPLVSVHIITIAILALFVNDICNFKIFHRQWHGPCYAMAQSQDAQHHQQQEAPSTPTFYHPRHELMLDRTSGEQAYHNSAKKSVDNVGTVATIVKEKKTHPDKYRSEGAVITSTATPSTDKTPLVQQHPRQRVKKKKKGQRRLLAAEFDPLSTPHGIKHDSPKIDRATFARVYNLATDVTSFNTASIAAQYSNGRNGAGANADGA